MTKICCAINCKSAMQIGNKSSVKSCKMYEEKRRKKERRKEERIHIYSLLKKTSFSFNT
jgi:hypothetical protein